ncbi:hypothetical protein CH63R_04035 [Colletotrichum higginsianum IMI 349063]|uniref:Uncharacterized protein n=1 Tax=Colletotrichum higginsianum (strain IMI 349063) TaxID=759273 RepID=A0A1B7YI35_COLHI|nr:hypothetical protein CH63R_04035 [Colletotrichum higginsianum IMI 349063]OBR11739.1 hypothetical protein CH63R_04035 [Colletotrichum higginsianum IMI 349063]
MRPTTPTPVSNWSKSPAPFDADDDRNGCTSPVGLRFACGSKRLEAVGKLRRVSKDERRFAPPQARNMALKKPAWLLSLTKERNGHALERHGVRQPDERTDISKRQLLPAGSHCRRPGLDAGRNPRKLAYRYLAAPHLTERRDEILSSTIEAQTAQCVCGSIALPLPVLPKPWIAEDDAQRQANTWQDNVPSARGRASSDCPDTMFHDYGRALVRECTPFPPGRWRR